MCPALPLQAPAVAAGPPPPQAPPAAASQRFHRTHNFVTPDGTGVQVHIAQFAVPLSTVETLGSMGLGLPIGDSSAMVFNVMGNDMFGPMAFGGGGGAG